MYMYTAFPTINMKETGKRIQSLRQQRGLSVKDVQNYFGFAYPQAIYKWQHGECLPTVDNLFALSRLLQVNMEDLLVIDREVHVFVGEFLLAETVSLDMKQSKLSADPFNISMWR